MQHGTGREAALDLIENVEATLRTWGGRPYNDLIRALNEAATILRSPISLDQRGVFGPDYGFDRDVPRVTQAEKDEAFVVVGALEVTEEDEWERGCHE